jgi:uncharacterized SAM-binding protein YcdF (DUF218 family)
VAAALVGCWLVASAFLFVWPREDEPRHADAVIVLSGAHSRLQTGIDLVRAGVAPLLVISDGTQPGWERGNSLCAGESRLAVLCFDPKPYSTHGEAEAIGRFARNRRWRTVLIVTSRYHVTRARLLVRRCTAARVEAVSSPTSAGAIAINVPWESAKLAYQLTAQRDC